MGNSRYAYPAVFTPENDGGYSVIFPDLEGCFTCGDDMADAIFMAEDCLALVLYGYEHDRKEIPAPSAPDEICLKEGEFINFISCDTLAYRKRFNKKAVKKTLTIPEWLNEAAIEKGLNFSQILQEALVEKIQL
jgi:predicted RNase H-like HicB family nuclease